MNDDLKYVLDGTAVATGIASFFEALPHVAALFTVIWLGLRIVESVLNLRGILLRRDWRKKQINLEVADDESDSAGI